jgi:hypothetical protein
MIGFGKHKDLLEKASGKIELLKKIRPSFHIVLKYVLLQIPSLIFLILALIVLR